MRIDPNFQRISYEPAVKYESNKNIRPSTSISTNDYQNTTYFNNRLTSDASTNKNQLYIPQNIEQKNVRSFDSLPYRNESFKLNNIEARNKLDLILKKNFILPAQQQYQSNDNIVNKEKINKTMIPE